MSIDVTRDESVALVTINRPSARNALDDEHNGDLASAIAGLNADRKIRAAVITGAGNSSFCAGVDLKTFLPPRRDRIRAGESPEWNVGGITGHDVDRIVIIAAINGHALAGGLELALACDIRLASNNATFGLAETKWGVIPGAGGSQRLPRAMPSGPAMEMLLTGDPIGSEDALRWGLINRILPRDDLTSEAMDLAKRIAHRAPLAVRAVRQAVLEGEAEGLARGLKNEYRHFLAIMRTQDAVEGSTAFSEKREPVYHGR